MPTPSTTTVPDVEDAFDDDFDNGADTVDVAADFGVVDVDDEAAVVDVDDADDGAGLFAISVAN